MAKAATTPTASTKAECKISRETFKAEAKPLMVVIDGQTKSVDAKEFSTGSFGWYMSDKMTMNIGGEFVKVQMSVNLTVIGSKEAK